MNVFERKLIEKTTRGDPYARFAAQISKAIDSVDVFKKLKQRDQKKMAGLNRQMQESRKAMEKARNKNEFLLRQEIK